MPASKRVPPSGDGARNIRLTLEYDGSAYCGFQRQPRGLSVQQVLEEALGRILGEKVKIAAASGRTDSGVHALGQVVNFRTHSARSAAEIVRGMNAVLPRDIAVCSAHEAAAGFHARYGAASKTYEYRIWNRPVRSPFEGRTSWHIASRLDLGAMRRAAKVLEGRHDFRAFCASGSRALDDTRRGTVRHVTALTVSRSGSMVRIRVTADGFLYRMVRNIAGALAACGQGRLTAEGLRAALEGRDRRRAPATAPAHGLRLLKVSYSQGRS